MPDDVQATETAQPAAATAPPVASPPAGKPEPAAKAEKPSKGKLGAPAPAPTASESPEPAAAPPGPTIEQLHDLAKQLGFEVENKLLTTRERVAMREHAKFLRENAEKEIAEARRNFDAEKSEWTPRMQRAEAIQSAYEAGDYEALAKALGAQSWDEVQDNIVKKLTDPHYKELQELKQWRIQEENRRKEAAEREQSEMVVRERANYKRDLSSMMKASSDPLVAAMHDDFGFIEAVYRIQEENWDGKQTVTPERAIKMAMRGAKFPLLDELRTLFDRLRPVFGTDAAAAAVEKAVEDHAADVEHETSNGGNGKRPSPKTAITDPARKPAPSAAGRRTDKEQIESYARLMREAAEQEQAELEKRRRPKA